MLEAENPKHESPAVLLKREVLASAGGLRRWHENSRREDHVLKARKEGLEDSSTSGSISFWGP
ncbi:hypothetical protein BELL_0283g00050 [Botrytis elliptica]|uniref:Uncharacterized protein n=1 Tax=Botrytis elliptica TaxID=278938 RepID=A0A4Z1JSA6_9HELO|nr:hypothetical protein BELL_0283g00050 [Botrytis elliptica]